MRIPGSKTYRAFPELDRFSNQQCERFMKAVKRDGLIARALRTAAAVAAFLLVLGGGYLAGAFVAGSFARTRSFGIDTTAGTLLALAWALVPMLAGLLAALVTRDVLLRWRLRSVINERARCVGCGYSLLGLAVGPELIVTCPECGATTEVDPSIAELQSGPAGAEFRPTVRVGPSTYSPAQRRRRVRITLAAVGLVLAVLLTPVAIWGWNELAMRIDAGRAAKARPGVAGLRRVMADLPAVPKGDQLSAWEEFEKVLASLSEVDAAAWKSGMRTLDENGNAIAPDYGMVGEAIGEVGDENRKGTEAARELASSMLPELRRHGTFDAMRRMREAGDLTPVVLAVPGEPLMNILMPELAKCREIARINKARALLALQSDDPAEFADAMQNVHAIARMCERKPSLIARLVSIAVDALGDGISKRALMTRHDARWIDAVEQGMTRRKPQVPFGYTLQAERTCTLDAASVFYESVKNVRRRQFELLEQRLDKGGSVRVGRFSEAVEEINAYFDAAVAESPLEVYQRSATGATKESEVWVVRTLVPAVIKSIRSMDQVEADRRGLQLMVALERHRADKGSYPQALLELVPHYVGAIPIDSWTGKPYLYKRLPDGSDPHGRPYLLYICGQDKTDDGGKPGEFFLDAITRPTLTGIDYIINDERH